jgi:hypothetical protein
MDVSSLWMMQRFNISSLLIFLAKSSVTSTPHPSTGVFLHSASATNLSFHLNCHSHSFFASVLLRTSGAFHSFPSKANQKPTLIFDSLP